MAPWGSNLCFFHLFLLFAGQRRLLAGEAFPTTTIQDSHWNLRDLRAVATLVHRADNKADKILWGRVDAKKAVFAKTSRDTSGEFITINWPQEEVSRCKGERRQMEEEIARCVSQGLMRCYSVKQKGSSMIIVLTICCMLEYNTFPENDLNRLFNGWNQSENQCTPQNILNKENLTGSQSIFLGPH